MEEVNTNQEQKSYIHVEYTILPEDIYQAAQLNDRRRKTRKHSLIGVGIIGLIGLYFFIQVILHPAILPNYLTVAMCVACGCVLYFSPAHSNRVFSKKLAASWSSYDMTIDQAGIRLFDARNPSMERRHHHLQYADGLEIYETPERFFFFPAGGKLFVLPKSVLTEEQRCFAHDTFQKQVGKRFFEQNQK